MKLPPQIDQHLADFFAGTITPEAMHELEAWLRLDPAHMDLLASYGLIEQGLVAIGRESTATDILAALAEVEPDPLANEFAAAEQTALELGITDDADTSDGSSAMDFVIDQALDERRKHDLEDDANRRLAAQQAEDARNRRYELRRQAEPEPTQRVIIIPKIVVWLGLAAVLLLGVILIGINTKQPTAAPAPIADNQDPSDTQLTPETPDPVATLTLIDNAVWSDTDQRLSLHSRVTPGALRLKSGIAHFVMDSGAVVMLKGPATIDLSTAWIAELSEGSAVARVPEQAQGFKIVGDGFEITDLGTEFAVHLSAGGMRCQVVLGEVELAVTEPGAARDTALRLRENRLVQVDPADRTVRDIEHDQADDIGWALPYAPLLNRELVVNGGFEDGPFATGNSDGHANNVAIPGWDDDGPATVLDYEQAGSMGGAAFPVPATDPMPDDRGRGFYAGCAAGTMTQDVDLSALAELTDAGKARFHLSADLGGLTNQNDYARVLIAFIDARGRVIGQAELDIVDAQARRHRSGFIHRSDEGGLPTGTRSARISLIAVHNAGGFTDAYADNISLTVEADSPEADDSQSASHGDAAQTPTDHSSWAQPNPLTQLPPATSRARLIS